MVAELVDVGQQHDAVQHRHAEQRYEAHGGTQVQVKLAKPERGDASDEREGDVEHDEERLARVAEARV